MAVARVTPAILRIEGPFTPNEPRGRLYLSEPRAPLGGRGAALALSLAMRFRVEPATVGDDRWEIRTFAYSYLVFRDDREVVGYHWDHEGVGSAVRIPHVHRGKDLPHAGLPRADRDRLGWLAAAHMPTGPIPFTAILRTAIRDFGVEQRRSHGESIEDALQRAESSFREAEAALTASFECWSRRGSVAE